MEGSGGKGEVDDSHLRVGKQVELRHQAEAVEAEAVQEQTLVHFLDPWHCADASSFSS